MAKHKQSELVQLQIIKATDDLLYQKGYNRMSFSDIADASGIPRGNLNYHFKTKQQVLNAVIDYRIQSTQAMLAEWDETILLPLDRLKRFVKITLNETDNICRYGCPMGSLNSELGKGQTDLQSVSQKHLRFFREWLNKQFSALLPEGNTDELALHFLAMTQGLVVLAHSFGDKAIIVSEGKHIIDWLDALEANA